MIPTEPFKEAYFYDDAVKFREAVQLPLVFVGGLISRETIDRVLDSGFEFVSMARALLNEPDFVNRMEREGNARNACEHVNYCIARMYSREMACHQHLHDLPQSLVREIDKSKRRG